MPTALRAGFQTVTISSTVPDSPVLCATPVRFELVGKGNTADRTETSAMKGPFCGFANERWLTRARARKRVIRRRRECLKCGKRLLLMSASTKSHMVVKKMDVVKSSTAESIDGLPASVRKPPSNQQTGAIVNEAESFVIESAERERKTSELGESDHEPARRYDK